MVELPDSFNDKERFLVDLNSCFSLQDADIILEIPGFTRNLSSIFNSLVELHSNGERFPLFSIMATAVYILRNVCSLDPESKASISNGSEGNACRN